MKSSTFDHKVVSCDATKNDAETKKESKFQKGTKRLIAASLSLTLGLGAVGSCELSNAAYKSEGANSLLITKAWANEVDDSSDNQPSNSYGIIKPFEGVTRITSALASDVSSGDLSLSNYSALCGTESELYKRHQRQANTDALVELALSLAGTPYRYGGTTTSGFDCSGFTMYCFRNILGMELPRSAAAQSGLGEERIAVADAQAGDLVFWGGGSGVYHVGISLGDGMYIHAAASGKVKVESIAVYRPSFAKRIY